jgi:epoxide hydrolase-like predicted phosphatase
MRKKEAVIFDWGGVLIDNPTVKMFNYLSNYFKIDEKELIRFYRNNCDKALQTGVEEEKIWEGLYEKFDIDGKTKPKIWKKAVENCFVDRKEIWNFVSELREKGYKTGFLSNTEKGAVEYFWENGYGECFDTAVFSCDEGIVKPNEQIYRVTLERLGVAANQAVFVDDKKENIEGAEKLGITGVLFTKRTDIEKISAII